MHQFHELFAQLGLPDDEPGMADFLNRHKGMADGMRLPDAPYWTEAQAQFLRESLRLDSDWSGLVDRLSQALRVTAPTPLLDPLLSTAAGHTP